MRIYLYHKGSKTSFMDYEAAYAPMDGDWLMFGHTWYVASGRYWFRRGHLGIILERTKHTAHIREPLATEEELPEPDWRSEMNKPCPFCWSNDLTVEDQPNPLKGDPHFHVVMCLNCGAEGPVAFTSEKAVKFWDRRDERSWRDDMEARNE